ncbi:hypothetical protein LCGC14_1560050 [marine sediment metagenome]|uniref:PD-(D/E)XK endonuclease-like domain-containing protein n=1 Tax=marine sediment metagenome TaxID=412755 RepID=A0A0F9IMT2_9ZZZZ
MRQLMSKLQSKGYLVKSNKRPVHVSATFIKAKNKCDYLCYLKYLLGLRTIHDTDPQRYGNRWHTCQEILGRSPGVCTTCAQKAANDPECPFCGGAGFIPEDRMELVVDYLNKYYAIVPPNKDEVEWLVERAKLMYGMAGYQWYYSESEYETLATELEFKLPVVNPRTGRTLPNCKLVGKIDKLVRNQNGVVMIMEHKTTSSSLDSDSSFWGNLRLNTQISMYVYAAQQMQLEGDLIPYGIQPTDPFIQECVFDGLRKPGIAPKKLSQGDSKEFVETGEYHGKKFEVDYTSCGYTIDGELAECEHGKKEGTYTIRETPEMYGMRLLTDMSERPEFYFGRREASRTTQEIEDFQKKIYNIYQSYKFMCRTETWSKDEDQCEATYVCEYAGLCYNNVDPAVGDIPGFKRIFERDKDVNKSTTSSE